MVLGFGLGPHPGPRPNIYILGKKSECNQKRHRNKTISFGFRWVSGLDQEFNSIHFSIEINKCLKFFDNQKMFGSRKNLRKFF
jgi:hypothetical protein